MKPCLSGVGIGVVVLIEFRECVPGRILDDEVVEFLEVAQKAFGAVRTKLLGNPGIERPHSGAGAVALFFSGGGQVNAHDAPVGLIGFPFDHAVAFEVVEQAAQGRFFHAHARSELGGRRSVLFDVEQGLPHRHGGSARRSQLAVLSGNTGPCKTHMEIDGVFRSHAYNIHYARIHSACITLYRNIPVGVRRKKPRNQAST